MTKRIYISLFFCLILWSCTGQKGKDPDQNTKYRSFGGELSQPKEAIVTFDPLIIDQLNNSQHETLKRYISGNTRWEVRKEKRYNPRGQNPFFYEITYAIRKEKQDGKYETSLNGFYSDFGDNSEIYQTRVILSFGQDYGHGNDTTHITYADSKDQQALTTIEAEHSGTPGNSSYLIIRGNSINIEIYEQAKKLERTFTIKTIDELNKELETALKFEKHINKNGRMPVSEYYPQLPDSNYFQIEDGIQPGIYVIKAGLILKEKGFVYTKTFNSATNKRLSAGRMTPRTTRILSWAPDGKTYFSYETELTVYEGDWNNQYEARFEIWFQPAIGPEIKLTEKSRIINGWER